MPCPPETPLYNHTLPDIENWLRSLDCKQDESDLSHWNIERSSWRAELWMEVDCLTVSYLNAAADGSNIERSFKYSLSRQDVEAAVFSEP
ncbi:MAG: DUF3143 domain-containing protein [Geitlerinemataceae cyanobacterium]